MNRLEELRQELDGLDRQLVELLCARMECSARVAGFKKESGGPVLVPEREKALLEKLRAQAGDGYVEALDQVYRAILSASRKIQKEKGCGVYGLIGEKLGHSFSPALHRKLGDYSYRLFELKPDELGDFLRTAGFDGLNVTIPYKKAVMEYCSDLTDQARRIGSVNTIVRRPDGTLLGHNTDYDGFCWLLRSAGAEVQGKKCLVLGSGGASLTVQTVLRDWGAGQVVVISRSGEHNYANLSRHADAQLLVNTTPVGMYPNTGESPVDLDLFPKLEGVFDLIYNPAGTELLLAAEDRGINCRGGLGMLTAQAKAASERFMDRVRPDSCVEQICKELERETKNVTLIGMPGCGKTSIGRVLAEKLDRPFLDLDEELEKRAGRTIPDLFREQEEEVFRQLEHEVLCDAAKGSGMVIATGGGVVTRRENNHPLRQNSTLVWIRRELRELPVQGRPISQKQDPETLYRSRKPLYEELAELTVENIGIEETAEEIIRRMKL